MGGYYYQVNRRGKRLGSKAMDGLKTHEGWREAIAKIFDSNIRNIINRKCQVLLLRHEILDKKINQWREVDKIHPDFYNPRSSGLS